MAPDRSARRGLRGLATLDAIVPGLGDGAKVDLDYHQIYNSLTAIVPKGAVFELRMLGARKGQVDSGYFDDPAQAANALVGAGGYYKGVYFTPNPVIPDALARSYNRITPWAQHSTHDTEITRRRWLMVDIDARRPVGISSNEVEKAATFATANTIAAILSVMYGFPQPMITDSGNGAWLMYRIDEENSDTVRDELHTFLRILKKLYDSDKVDMDTTVYNAARISRVPGTWARKGDSTPDRPHRRGGIVQTADAFKVLSIITVMRFNAQNQHLLAAEAKPTGARKNANEYPADEVLYKRLNEFAMRNVKSWVLTFFPTAREYKEGYRVNSADIGQTYEEDLTIHPWPLGIKYFGVGDQGDSTEGRRTPISVIAEYGLQTTDKRLAAQKLSDALNYPMTEMGAIAPQPALTAGYSATGGINSLLGTKPRFDFKGIRSIADLRQRQFKDVEWIVKDVIPTGNMLLAARPKMRKTWLALQLALAVARGREFLGYQCNKSDVLFLGLEDNDRRINNRINTLMKFEMDGGDLSGFRYWTGGMDYDGNGQLKLTNPEEEQALLQSFPRGEAGVDALEQFLEQYPQTKLIVIDTLAHFRGERASRDIYQSDYESMMPITKLAARKGVCLMPVTHEKKGNADRGIGGDFLEDVTGSAGISGGVDGVISIKGRRGVQEENESRKLLISGRDVPFDYELDISFDAERGGWHKAAKEDVKVAIRALLTVHPFLNQRDIQNLLPHAGQARLYRALTDMKLEGEIEQGKFGYALKR